MGQPPPEFFNRPPPGFYHQQEMPGYEEQQWMDSVGFNEHKIQFEGVKTELFHFNLIAMGNGRAGHRSKFFREIGRASCRERV